MDFLSVLKQAAKSDNSVYIRLLQQYKKEEKSLHLFYEGKDDPSFYTNFVHKYVSKETPIYFYNCKNKNAAINNSKKIDWRVYKKYRVLFFVDKDHSDFVGEIIPSSSNFFITKYYSVENYLVTSTMFKRIIRDFMGLDDDKFINPILRDFKIQHKVFSKEMILLSSYIIYHRELKSELQLNNVKLSDLFAYSSTNIRKNPKPKGKKIQQYLDTKNKICSPANSWKPIKELYKRLTLITNPKFYIRGKYEMWFLISYLNNLMCELNKDKKKGDPKYKLNTSISISNSIALLGPRLRIPSDIKLFLQENLSKL